MARPNRLLFVCTGNICRSPLAHRIAAARGRATNIDLEVQSASTLGLVDRPADGRMTRVATEIGLDLSPHRSQPLTAELVRWADQTWVMEVAHHAFACSLAPECADRVRLLGREVGVDEIADPIDAWFLWRFRRCRTQLVRAVHQVVDRLPTDVDEPAG